MTSNGDTKRTGAPTSSSNQYGHFGDEGETGGNGDNDNIDIDLSDLNAQTIDDDGLPLPSPSSAIRALQQHTSPSNGHDNGDVSEMDDDRSIDPMRHREMNTRLRNAQFSTFDRLAMRSRLLVACSAALISALFTLFAFYLCVTQSWNDHWMDLLLYTLLLLPTSFIAYRRLSYYYKVVPPHLRSLHGGISDLELAELGGVAPSAASSSASLATRRAQSHQSASSSSRQRTMNDNVGFDLGAGGEAMMWSARDHASSNGNGHSNGNGNGSYLEQAMSQLRANEEKQLADLSPPLPADDSDDEDHIDGHASSQRDDDIDRPGRCRIESGVLAASSIIILFLTLLIVPSPNVLVSLLSIFFGLTIWCVLYFIIHGTIEKPHHDSVWLSILIATAIYVVFLSTKHFYPACPGVVRGRSDQPYESEIASVPWNCISPRFSIIDETMTSSDTIDVGESTIIDASQLLYGRPPTANITYDNMTHRWTIIGRLPIVNWTKFKPTNSIPKARTYFMKLSLECNGRVDAQHQNRYGNDAAISTIEEPDATPLDATNSKGVTVIQLIQPLVMDIHHDNDGVDNPSEPTTSVIHVNDVTSTGSQWLWTPCTYEPPPTWTTMRFDDRYVSIAVLCCSILVMLWPTLRCLSFARNYGFCLCRWCPWCRRSYHGLHHAPDSA